MMIIDGKKEAEILRLEIKKEIDLLKVQLEEVKASSSNPLAN